MINNGLWNRAGWWIYFQIQDSESDPNSQIKHIWIDYDKAADVLHVSFRRPQRAEKTVEKDDDLLIRMDGDEIVGITIMDASSRQWDHEMY